MGGLFITGIQFEDPIDLAEISRILHVADLETKESVVSIRSAQEMVDTYVGGAAADSRHGHHVANHQIGTYAAADEQARGVILAAMFMRRE